MPNFRKIFPPTLRGATSSYTTLATPTPDGVGSLLERLTTAFINYWRSRGVRLHEPESPLSVVIFAKKQDYLAHAREEIGDAAEGVVGYYSLRTNRVTMFDLTGLQTGGGRGNRAEITRMLRQPQAAVNIATVVHEATHQAAYNTGLHRRFADVPLWVAEGVAVYFETPDLDSSRGWRRVDEINPPRFQRFLRYAANRPANSLRTLLADDSRFRNLESANDAYAEAWALNYFLLQTQHKRYAEYLKTLAEKPPLVYDSPEERIAAFEIALGGSVEQIDAAFLRYMQRLRY